MYRWRETLVSCINICRPTQILFGGSRWDINFCNKNSCLPRSRFPRRPWPPSCGCLCHLPANRAAFSHCCLGLSITWPINAQERIYWRSGGATQSQVSWPMTAMSAVSCHVCFARCWMCLNLRPAALGWSDQIYPGHFRRKLQAARVHYRLVWVSSPQLSDCPLESCFHTRHFWILHWCQVASFLQSVPVISSKFFGCCGR